MGKFIMNKNGFGSVIATALLIVVSVFAVIGYQTWFQTYSSQILTNDVLNNYDSNIQILDLIDNNLYLKFDDNNFINSIIIENENSTQICNYNIENNNVSDLGLVAYWNFDNCNSSGCFDESENDNFAYFENGSSLENNIVKGKIGNAFEFKDIAEYLNIINNPSLDLNEISIAFWFKKKSNVPRKIMRKYGSFILDTAGTGNYIQMFIWNASSQEWKADYSNDLDWNYEVVTYDKNELKIYKNSVLAVIDVQSGDLKGPMLESVSDFNIGAPDNSFDGYVDEIRIFNRSLSQEEINNLYSFNDIQFNNLNGVSNLNLNCNLTKDNIYETILITDSGVYSKKFYYD